MPNTPQPLLTELQNPHTHHKTSPRYTPLSRPQQNETATEEEPTPNWTAARPRGHGTFHLDPLVRRY